MASDPEPKKMKTSIDVIVNGLPGNMGQEVGFCIFLDVDGPFQEC